VQRARARGRERERVSVCNYRNKLNELIHVQREGLKPKLIIIIKKKQNIIKFFY
jgi:hypothetical protein